MHFRGLLYCWGAPDTPFWAPLCSTRVDPKRGEVTTDPRRVTCNECRTVLKLPKIPDPEPHWSNN